jgi:hypothetical protein
VLELSFCILTRRKDALALHTENISAYALTRRTVKLLNERDDSSAQFSSFTEDTPHDKFKGASTSGDFQEALVNAIAAAKGIRRDMRKLGHDVNKCCGACFFDLPTYPKMILGHSKFCTIKSTPYPT